LHEILGTYPDLDRTEIVFRGGYPELYEDVTLEPSAFYRSYVAI
jgi:hypothetical protein